MYVLHNYSIGGIVVTGLVEAKAKFGGTSEEGVINSD